MKYLEYKFYLFQASFQVKTIDGHLYHQVVTVRTDLQFQTSVIAHPQMFITNVHSLHGKDRIYFSSVAKSKIMYFQGQRSNLSDNMRHQTSREALNIMEDQ